MRTGEPPPSTTVEVVDDVPGEFAERVVDSFHYRRGERFRLALAGGDGARRCYEQLARHAETQVDWWLVEVFTDQPDLVRRCLLDHVGAAHAVHPLPASATDAIAALSVPGPSRSEAGGSPRVDLLHLDLARDGTLSGPGAGVRADLVVVTASGARCAGALARLAADPAQLAERLPTRRLLVLADRAATQPRPPAHSH